MKILVLSDSHIKTADRYGLCELKIDKLTKILAHWHEQISAVIVTGDLFDKREPYIPLVTKIAEILAGCHKPTYILSGNHDSIEREFHPLSPYIVGTGNHKIIGEEPLRIENLILQGWNGGATIPECNKGDVYFGHLNLADCIGKGLTLEELEATNYKRIFTGDLHDHFTKGKVTSIGCFPSTFSDEGYVASYLVYDTLGDTFEHFSLEFPRFVTVTVDGNNWENLDQVAGNIVRIKATYPCDKDAAVEKVLALRPHKFTRITIKKNLVEQEVTKLETLSPLEIITEEARTQQWSEEQLTLARENL